MKIRGIQSKSFVQSCRLKLWQKGSLFSVFKPLKALCFLVSVCFYPTIASAEEISAKNDYIQDCKYATCVGLAGSEWSENHPYGVAVAVRMGTKPVVTDDQIKQVLTRDLNKNGITEIKFFYEQNDTPATGIFLHVRGGTEGIFLIDNVRDHIALVAERAKMTDPVFMP